MTIIIDHKPVICDVFNSPLQLKLCLEQNPNLLDSRMGSSIKIAGRDIAIPNIGTVDFLMIDEKGCPVFALIDSDESFNETVGFIFSLASFLPRLSASFFNECLNGNLLRVLESYNTNNDLWVEFSSYLRLNSARFFIVTNKTTKELTRTIDYIANNSGLDLSLIEVQSFNSGQIIIPTVVVESGLSHSLGSCAVCCDPRIPSLYNEIITMYNLLASPQLKTLDNSTSSSHMVKYNHWPNGVHYGFYLNQPLNLISIELRVTDINLAPVLNTLKKHLSSDIGGQPVELLPESDHVIGGLCLVLSLEGLEVVADAVGAMVGLITLTNQTVSNAIDRK